MATKESLLEKAKSLGLTFQSKAKKADIEEAVANAEKDSSLPQQTKEAMGDSTLSPETDENTTVPQNFNPQIVNKRPDIADYINENSHNNDELSLKKQQKLEKELSDEKNGITARVTSSTGNYLKVKFLKDHKPFAIYKSRMGYNKGEILEFVKEQRKLQGF